MNCWTCKHSMGADKHTCDRLILLPNYRSGGGGMKDKMALICQLHSTVYPAPYAGCGFAKEVGSDDELVSATAP